MARVIQYTNFVSLRIRLMDQLFQFAGDINNLHFSTDIPVNNPVKTMLTVGTIYFEILDIGFAEQATAPGDVLPSPLSSTGKMFRVTALEDNTHVHCVQPMFSGNTIVYAESNLAANEVLNVAVGNLVFVFGTNYKVQDGSYNDFHIFAVQNSAVVIQAVEPCRVVIFTSVPL